MTDHERAIIDAFNDYALKLQHLESVEKEAKKARDEKESAWNLLQTMARGGTTPA